MYKMLQVPDWLHPDTLVYWLNQIQAFRDKVTVDGIWLDMNEPASFCDGNYDVNENMNLTGDTAWSCPVERYPDELIKQNNSEPEFPLAELDRIVSLNHRTVSTNATLYDGSLMYDRHNMFGNLEAYVTSKVVQTLVGERPFVLSRDSFPGAGQFSGSWYVHGISHFTYILRYPVYKSV